VDRKLEGLDSEHDRDEKDKVVFAPSVGWHVVELKFLMNAMVVANELLFVSDRLPRVVPWSRLEIRRGY
jgi:hypothetical protein